MYPYSVRFHRHWLFVTFAENLKLMPDNAALSDWATSSLTLLSLSAQLGLSVQCNKNSTVGGEVLVYILLLRTGRFPNTSANPIGLVIHSRRQTNKA